MAKAKEEKPATWKDSMKEFGGGNFTFLSVDGEVLIFIVVGLPVLLISKFKGKENERIGCPVVTDEGYMLFVTGKRLARKLSKVEDKFRDNALMVIRHGAEGDINATYEVKIIDDEETVNRLKGIANTDFDESMIPESVEAVKAVLDN